MRKMGTFFPICFCSCLLASARSFDELKTKLENCLRENDIPGAAVAVVTGDSVLFTGGFGYANLEKKIPVTVHTHFWLGSISKSFTALGIMKLVEDGRVDLNVPLKDILPDVDLRNPWEDTDPVRLVHLLEHTAGLCDGFSVLFNWRHDPDIPLSEAIRLTKRIVIHHRPGSFYLYSNIGYLLAGAVIEKIARMRYEEFLKREFLLPLGMVTTTFNPQDPYSRSVLAQGYGAGGKATPFLYTYFRPAANSYSSILDMAQYVRFYLNYGQCRGVQILKQESLKRMETPETALASRAGLLNGYGLGNEWAFRNQHKWRGHNGAGFGNYSDFWYNRDLGIGYVVLINQFDVQTRGKVRKLRELIAEHLTQGLKPTFQPIRSIPKQEMKKQCGTYTIGYGAKDPLGLINFIDGMTEVRLSGEALSLKHPLSGNQETFYPVSNQLFREQDLPEPTLAIFSTPDGAQAMVLGRDYLEKLSPWKYWLIIFFLAWSLLSMLLTTPLALCSVSVSVYKKIRKTQPIAPGVFVNLFLFMATLALTTGIILIGRQELYYWGKLTFASISFLFSTWLFALFSVAGLVSAIMCLKKPIGKASRVYHLVASCTYVGFAFFLWYWGIIGLKLWL